MNRILLAQHVSKLTDTSFKLHGSSVSLSLRFFIGFHCNIESCNYDGADASLALLCITFHLKTLSIIEHDLLDMFYSAQIAAS